MNDRAPYNGSSAFLIRRSRLKMDGFVHSTKLKYKLELGLSNRDLAGAVPETRNTPLLLFDAVLKWNFFKNLELWAGQTKLPGNRERVISSGDLQFVDRSALNAKYNIDRDIGIQLRNHHSLNNGVVIREIFAFSQGEGRNITAGNLGGFDFTGRLEILPFGNFKSKGDYTGG
ncbi:MAG: porin, partial [Flavobacteriales bacterium]|nr:porin [Flavobacteriales bacterium]